jgi:Arc/MetJ-type ribon-helix-helix transcriptional regulator
MNEATLTVSLPQTMKDYISAKLRQGRFSTPNEYIRSLIRECQDLEGSPNPALFVCRGEQSRVKPKK